MSSDIGALRNIRLLLAYDGTDFHGWERQGGAGDGKTRTVQGTIEKALEKIHKKHLTLTGSGRTDAGVHAAFQCANFYTNIQSMEAGRFVPALNSLLPHDVRILEAEETRRDFHARFDARQRTYRYYFIVSPEANPFELRYAWHLRRNPDIRQLNDYAQLLHGEMDCSSFSSSGDKSKSKYRYISGSSFFYEGNRLVFEISANAFLWKMVRSIAGTLLFFEERKYSVLDLQKLIESKDRTLAGPTAPPQGLFLWKVDYYRE